MKHSVSNRIVIGVGLTLIIGGLIAFKKMDSGSSDSDSTLGTVTRADLIQRVTISGQIWPRRRLDVKPPFSSYIEKVYVKIGDRVKQGDPLVTFSPSLGRGETNFPVRSAFSGVVTQVLKNEGEHVLDSGDQNNIVVRVEDLSQLYVMVVAPELDIAKLKVGQEATIRISSLVGETFSGKISEISMSAKDRERWGSSSAEFQLKVQLNEHDARLFPGMSALLDIVTDRANHVLTLPHEYIQEKNGAFFVTAASGQTKNIVLGLRSEEGAEIKSGLTEGDRVQVIDFLKLPKIEN